MNPGGALNNDTRSPKEKVSMIPISHFELSETETICWDVDLSWHSNFYNSVVKKCKFTIFIIYLISKFNIFIMQSNN